MFHRTIEPLRHGIVVRTARLWKQFEAIRWIMTFTFCVKYACFFMFLEMFRSVCHISHVDLVVCCRRTRTCGELPCTWLRVHPLSSSPTSSCVRWRRSKCAFKPHPAGLAPSVRACRSCSERRALWGTAIVCIYVCCLKLI